VNRAAQDEQQYCTRYRPWSGEEQERPDDGFESQRERADCCGRGRRQQRRRRPRRRVVPRRSTRCVSRALALCPCSPALLTCSLSALLCSSPRRQSGAGKSGGGKSGKGKSGGKSGKGKSGGKKAPQSRSSRAGLQVSRTLQHFDREERAREFELSNRPGFELLRQGDMASSARWSTRPPHTCPHDPRPSALFQRDAATPRDPCVGVRKFK
jgi:hypothetical protein